MSQDEFRENAALIGFVLAYGPIDCRPGAMVWVTDIRTPWWRFWP